MVNFTTGHFLILIIQLKYCNFINNSNISEHSLTRKSQLYDDSVTRVHHKEGE